MLSNKDVWKHAPIATTILLEGANIGHIARMVTEKTSQGQSLLSWCYVTVALMLWWNWYRIFTPEQKIAQYTCLFGIFLNVVVVSTVIWFRYFV